MRCKACDQILDNGEELLMKDNGEPEDLCFDCLMYIPDDDDDLIY